jgi:hypothetical protein
VNGKEDKFQRERVLKAGLERVGFPQNKAGRRRIENEK